MALRAQVLDHSGWFSNPLRFNNFGSCWMGCERGRTGHAGAGSFKFDPTAEQDARGRRLEA